MARFGKFLEGIFSSNSPESSKRFFGAIGYICAIVFIGLWAHTLIDVLLYVSAGLLGLETITQIWSKK